MTRAPSWRDIAPRARRQRLPHRLSTDVLATSGICEKPLQRNALQGRGFIVGAPGFEPGTSCSQSRRDTRLRYAPKYGEVTIPCLQRATQLAAPETRARDDSAMLFFRSLIRRMFRPAPAPRSRDRSQNLGDHADFRGRVLRFHPDASTRPANP